jgi:hypothetical protein
MQRVQPHHGRRGGHRTQALVRGVRAVGLSEAVPARDERHRLFVVHGVAAGTS